MISVNENGTLAGQLVCYHSNINHEMYWILPNGSSLYASSDLYNVSKGLNINGTVFQFLTLRFNKEANVGSYRCVHDNDIVGVWIVDYEFQSKNFIYLSIYFVYLFIYLFTFLSIYLSIYLFVYLSIYFVYLFIYLFTFLSIYLSIYL